MARLIGENVQVTDTKTQFHSNKTKALENTQELLFVGLPTASSNQIIEDVNKIVDF